MCNKRLDLVNRSLALRENMHIWCLRWTGKRGNHYEVANGAAESSSAHV
jgi:hypothetical protein